MAIFVKLVRRVQWGGVGKHSQDQSVNGGAWGDICLVDHEPSKIQIFNIRSKTKN